MLHCHYRYENLLAANDREIFTMEEIHGEQELMGEMGIQ